MVSLEIQNKTLEKLSNLPRYNNYLFSLFKPFLGNKILEIGSGTGNISDAIISTGKEITLSDLDNFFLDILKIKYQNKIIKLDISLKEDTDKLHNSFDSIVGINVLEHTEDDEKALRNLNSILKKNGNIILIVPAMNILFSRYDHLIGHIRRYSGKSIKLKLESAGFIVDKIYYFNKIGALGWYFNFQILNKRQFSNFQLTIFKHFIKLIKIIDFIIPFNFGLSILCVAKKN